MIHQSINTKAKLAHTLLISEDDAFASGIKSLIDQTGAMTSEVIAATVESVDIAKVKTASVLVIDLDCRIKNDLSALQRLMTRSGGHIPVIVVTPAFDEAAARWLLQIRVCDFFKKPVEPYEVLRSCLKALSSPGIEVSTDARILTFIPAAGGVGVTTLAVQTAHILMAQGNQTNKDHPNTCIVDLDFQHGSCADYLDIEPRLDLSEIVPRPDRLDQQLLEVMLSPHPSGLAMIAAPSKPAEVPSVDPAIVTRLLDLVSAHFDNVIIDMPRTWFPWTDSVLSGSNDVVIVTEMTVPGLRHAHRLSTALKERLGENVRPKIIVNRFEESMFGSGLKRKDIEKVLGSSLAGVIPNNYRLVREAIDRGVPMDDIKAGNKISESLQAMIAPKAKQNNQAGKSLLGRLLKPA